MPRNYETSILGHDVVIAGPGKFSELAGIVGDDDAMEYTVMGLLYRGPFARWRDKYFKIIEERFGVKLEPKEPAVKDAAGKTVKPEKWPTDRESQRQLADKVAEKTGQPCDPAADFQFAMDQALAELPFEEALKSSERTGGAIGKEWLELARKGIARVNEEKGGSFEDFLTNVRKVIPSAVLPAEPTEEDVARLLKRKYDAERKAAAGAMF